ncbi:putative CFEM domain-containing protein [Rosellinia necatrix]|uniref:Putative CFEM domain-containing protein n=1 Tax=Rosellinia necatrix TaxID=77044 RepID=A0A1W2TCT1_ROSNE|nr:putative CFEM domain-containing protein [Rosellinia necatrix]
MESLPSCAVSCLGAAIANSTCGALDTACQCSNEAFGAQVSTCIFATCTIRQALAAKKLTSLQCGIQPVVNHSFLVPISVLFGLAGLAVLLRLISRFRGATKFWWDDLCNFLALLTGGVLLGTVIKATRLGFGTDIWAVDPDNITTFFKIALSDFQIYGICRILIRSSIILFYIRVFSLTQASKTLWVTFAANLIIWITWFFISIFQCSPVSYFWTQWDGEHQGWCISANAVSWSGGGVDLAQDLVILALPFPYLRHLKLSLWNKIATLIMFSVGSLTIAFSIVRLTTIPHFTVSVNSTLDAVPIFLWSALELYVGIICACLPSLYRFVLPVLHWFGGFVHPTRSREPLKATEDPGVEMRNEAKRDRKKFRPYWDITLASTVATSRSEDNADEHSSSRVPDVEMALQRAHPDDGHLPRV